MKKELTKKDYHNFMLSVNAQIKETERRLETLDKTKKVSQLSFEDWVKYQNGELKISYVDWTEQDVKDFSDDEYHAYCKEQNEQRRSEWGLSMADAITVDDAKSLQEYAESLGKAAMGVLYGVRLDGIPRETLGKQMCDLHDRLGLFTAVLDRIDENRH